MISVCITLTAKPDKKRELEQILCSLKENIEKENGCSGCHAYRSLENQDEYVLFEKWGDEALAWDHLQSDNIAILSGARSVLTYNTSVSLDKYLLLEKLEEIYKNRFGIK